jgi:PAS domain S-box-containing protein
LIRKGNLIITILGFMRIGTKLLLSFLIVAFLVLITGSLSYYLSNEIKNKLILESGNTAEQLQSLTEMTVQLQNSLLYTRNYLTESAKQRMGDESLSVSAQIRLSEEISQNSLDEFQSALTELSQKEIPDILEESDNLTIHDEIVSLTDSLERSFAFYNSLIRELYELEREESFGDEMFNLTIEPYFRNTLLPILLNLRTAYNDQVEVRLDRLQIRAETTLRNIILYSVLAFVIALLLAYLVYLSITKPVGKLAQAAKELGNGDLTKRIELNTNDEFAHLANTFNIMADNLSKSMVSRSYVNNIIQSMGEMLIVTDANGKIELMNRTVADKLFFDLNNLQNEEFWHLISGEERESVKKIILGNSTDHGLVETRFVSKYGEIVPVNLTYSSLDNGEEKMKFIFVASDISLQKEAERKISSSLQEKNVLLAEIHHRVKNNLAVVSGLLEMQVWSTEDEESTKVLRDSQLRIQSIALVHEKLYQTDNFADIKIVEYVEDLVEGIAESFKDPAKKIDINIDCQDISMSINQAIPFSLLLNESVVNVYKHAFEDRSKGSYTISLVKENGSITMSVSDNGVGLKVEVKNMKNVSLGMTLIETLTKQLDGKYRLINGPVKGTLFEVIFPSE